MRVVKNNMFPYIGNQPIHEIPLNDSLCCNVQKSVIILTLPMHYKCDQKQHGPFLLKQDCQSFPTHQPYTMKIQ